MRKAMQAMKEEFNKEKKLKETQFEMMKLRNSNSNENLHGECH